MLQKCVFKKKIGRGAGHAHGREARLVMGLSLVMGANTVSVQERGEGLRGLI